MHKPANEPHVTRRALVAGAAAGAVALASEPAWRSGARRRRRRARAGRTSGSNLDQHELDEAYDQSVYAFNQRHMQERRDERNELMAKVLGKPERVAYGPAEIEKVDIYKTKRPNAPDHDLSARRRLARRPLGAGRLSRRAVRQGRRNFINVEFDNVPETKGDLMPMVDQCRRAVAWVYRNAKSFGGDPNALYLSGFSSGSHLGGCVVITEWEKQGLPRDILKGAVLGSGMYDLKPVRMSARSSYVKFTDADGAGAVRHAPSRQGPYAAGADHRHPGDAGIPAPVARLCGRADQGRQAGEADRRQGSQSLRDGRVAQQSLRDHGACCHGDDEADDRGVTREDVMKQETTKSKMTRRALVAGAAVGAVALAADKADAQRCPATPPARTKGPAIWLDYDQHDMNEMYDQSVFAFNQKHMLARSDANNVIASRDHRQVRALRLWRRRRSKASMSGGPGSRTRRC